MRYPDLLICRHGETEWNVEGRFQGALDSPLTVQGRAQAENQRNILSLLTTIPDRVFSSPLKRVLDTAEIALRGRDVDIKRDARLCEIDMGDWSGKRREDVLPRARILDDLADDPMALYRLKETGEDFPALRGRCQDFLDDLSGPALVFTHGVTSRMLRAIVLGIADAHLGDLPGGQGVVYHLRDGLQTRLE